MYHLHYKRCFYSLLGFLSSSFYFSSASSSLSSSSLSSSSLSSSSLSFSSSSLASNFLLLLLFCEFSPSLVVVCFCLRLFLVEILLEGPLLKRFYSKVFLGFSQAFFSEILAILSTILLGSIQEAPQPNQIGTNRHTHSKYRYLIKSSLDSRCSRMQTTTSDVIEPQSSILGPSSQLIENFNSISIRDGSIPVDIIGLHVFFFGN